VSSLRLSSVVVVELVVVGMLLLQVVVVGVSTLRNLRLMLGLMLGPGLMCRRRWWSVVGVGAVLRPVQPGVGVDVAGGAAGVETVVVHLYLVVVVDAGIGGWLSL
jgi:hypothetical protein